MDMIDKSIYSENESDNITNDVSSQASSTTPVVIDLEIQDIEGVGPTTARKLKEAGIVSVMDLAVTSADELAVDLNSSKETAATFIMAAQRLLRESNILEKEFVTAESALEKEITNEMFYRFSCFRRTIARWHRNTGCYRILWRVWIGKSQICHTLSAIATQPTEAGGLNGNVIYIDTEGTFRPERLNQIARAS